MYSPFKQRIVANNVPGTLASCGVCTQVEQKVNNDAQRHVITLYIIK